MWIMLEELNFVCSIICSKCMSSLYFVTRTFEQTLIEFGTGGKGEHKMLLNEFNSSSLPFSVI
jgi:hypothetical protein